MVFDKGATSLFTCGYSVFLAPFAEGTVLSPLNSFVMFGRLDIICEFSTNDIFK